MFRLSLLAFVSLFLISCATDGVGRYRVQSIGNAQRSVFADILSASPVYIQEQTSGAGAALGGTVGGGLAAEESDNVAVIIAGVLVGAVVGEYIEGQANIHNATEYILRTERNVLLTVAQVDAGNTIFRPNDRVVLVYGYPNRLLPAP